MIILTDDKVWPYKVMIKDKNLPRSDTTRGYRNAREVWVYNNVGIYNSNNEKYSCMHIRDHYLFRDEKFALKFDSVWGLNKI